MRHGEPQLLDRRGPGLSQVVTRDRDRVPARKPLLAVGEQIGRESHRWPRRKYVGAPGGVFLQDVVLDGAVEAIPGYALLLGNELVQQEQESGGGVDCPRGGGPAPPGGGAPPLPVPL